jgi:hypothetical protein
MQTTIEEMRIPMRLRSTRSHIRGGDKVQKRKKLFDGRGIRNDHGL